jgi:hypothetical protein
LGALFFATAATHLVHIALYRQALTANILPKIWHTVFSPSEYFCVRSRMHTRTAMAQQGRQQEGGACRVQPRHRAVAFITRTPGLPCFAQPTPYRGQASRPLAAAPFLDIR